MGFNTLVSHLPCGTWVTATQVREKKKLVGSLKDELKELKMKTEVEVRYMHKDLAAGEWLGVWLGALGVAVDDMLHRMSSLLCCNPLQIHGDHQPCMSHIMLCMFTHAVALLHRQ